MRFFDISRAPFKKSRNDGFGYEHCRHESTCIAVVVGVDVSPVIGFAEHLLGAVSLGMRSAVVLDRDITVRFFRNAQGMPRSNKAWRD